MLSFLIEKVHASGNLGSAIGKLKDSGATAGTAEVADAGVLIGNVIATALSFVGTIFLLLAVYAGFMWMTAQGEEEKVGKAQKILRGASVGLLIVVSAYALTFTVGRRFAGGSATVDSGPAEQGPVGCCTIRDLDDANNDTRDQLTEAACIALDDDQNQNLDTNWAPQCAN